MFDYREYEEFGVKKGLESSLDEIRKELSSKMDVGKLEKRQCEYDSFKDKWYINGKSLEYYMYVMANIIITPCSNTSIVISNDVDVEFLQEILLKFLMNFPDVKEKISIYNKSRIVFSYPEFEKRQIKFLYRKGLRRC